MTRPIALVGTIAIVFTAAIQSARAGDADKVHAVGKDGLSLQGKVAADDPKVKVIVGNKFGLLPAKLFQVKLQAGKKYRISMDSKEIDSVLIVQDMNDKQLAWDDDSGGDLNSLLTLNVEKDGGYKIYAASLKGTGGFTLKVQLAGDANMVHTVGKDGLVLQGHLAASDVEVKVRAGAMRLVMRAKQFDVRLSAGRRYRVTLDSKEIDTILVVQNESGDHLGWDDDSGGDRNSLLMLDVLSEATYKIFASGKSAGRFVLKVQEAGDVKIHHVGKDSLKLNGQLGKAQAVTYNIKLAAAKTYVIDMISFNQEALDPFLRLLDANGKLLAEDDDGGDGLNARIIYRAAKAATFQVVATMFNEGRGGFTLGIREAKPGEKALSSEQQKGLARRAELRTRAEQLVDERKLAEAIVVAEQVLALEKAILGDLHEDVVATFGALARLHELRENFAEARKARLEAVSIQAKVNGLSHWKHTDARLALVDTELLAKLSRQDRDLVAKTNQWNDEAVKLSRAGQTAKALKLVQDCLAICKKLLGENHRAYTTSLNNLAHIYSTLGYYAKAEPLYRRAVEIEMKVLGEGHPSYAVSVNNLAAMCEFQGRYAEAESLFEQALAITKDAEGERHPDYVRWLNNLAGVYGSQDKYAKAESTYLRAIRICKEVQGEKNADLATSLNNLAFFYNAQANYAQAELLWLQALEMRQEVLGKQHRDYAVSLNNLGGAYQSRGEYAKAESFYRQALELRRQLLGDRHPEVADSLNNLAGLYNAQWNIAKAEKLYRQALEIRRQVPGENHPDYAQSLHNLAAIHESHGDFAEAQKLYQRALKIRKDTLGEKSPLYATSLNNLGLLYHDRGEYAKAEVLLREAMEIRRAVLGERHPDYATSVNNLAHLYGSQQDFARAEPLYHQATRLRKDILGENHPLYAKSLHNLGHLYALQGNQAAAEAWFRKAVSAAQIHQATLPIGKLQAEDLRVHPDSVWFLGNQARALFFQKSAVGELTEEVLGSCDRTCRLAMTVLDRVRRENLDHPDSKTDLTARQFDLFPFRTKILARLFAHDHDPAHLAAAFWTAEQGAARTFLETLGNDRANYLAGVSPALQREEAHMLQEIRLLDMRIDKESGRPLEQRNSDLVGELLGRRRDFEDKLRKLVVEIEKQHPQYAGLKYPRPCNLQEARKCLAPDEVALLFVLGSDASYVVVVEARPQRGDKSKGLAIIELPRSEILAGHVDVLKEVDTLALPARVKALGRAAFDAILGPCKERIAGKSLVVVPSGALCMLPFELLVEGDGQYLVEKHRVRYAPSLTALHLINRWKEKRGQPEVPLFAVGDAIYEAGDVRVAKASKPVEVASASAEGVLDLQARQGKRDDLKRLIASGIEVAEIAKVLGAKANYLLTGEDASEAKVKAASAAETMAQARYVHFATHGILGVNKGKNPALVLNLVGNSGKDGDDGFLEYDEILNLKLNADLVVLSACRTGQGRMARGEGVTGLARAFLYAGSKGVVCSLWSVDDRETANLMVDFYGHLQKGRPAAEALREAQLAMIRAGKAPLYWAPFILIGE